MPSCAHKFVFFESWRFAGQACASSSPSRDGSRNSDAGRFFCSGKAALGGWSAGCGLIGAWSVVGGVTAGAGAGGSRGRSVKPACCHATGSDDCCVASVYVVSSAAGGVERAGAAAAGAAANGVTAAGDCADGCFGGAGCVAVAAGAWGVSMGAAAGSYKKQASWLLEGYLRRRRAAAQDVGGAFRRCWASLQSLKDVLTGPRGVALIRQAPTLYAPVFVRGARGYREAIAWLD